MYDENLLHERLAEMARVCDGLGQPAARQRHPLVDGNRRESHSTSSPAPLRPSAQWRGAGSSDALDALLAEERENVELSELERCRAIARNAIAQRDEALGHLTNALDETERARTVARHARARRTRPRLLVRTEAPRARHPRGISTRVQ